MIKMSVNGAHKRRLTRNLRLLARNSKDRKRYFRQAGAYMVQKSVECFAREKTPDGKRWKKLKPATLEARARGPRARAGKRILQVTGALKNSLGIIEIWENGVRQGPSLGIFQGIGRAHQFGRPEINLPPREFMGITAKMDKHMTNDLVHHVFRGVRSG